MPFITSALFLGLTSLLAASGEAQNTPTIIFATTTSTYDTGLRDSLLLRSRMAGYAWARGNDRWRS